MRRFFPCIAMALMILLSPGTGEVIENLLHFAKSGHGAHAVADAEHQLSGPEHGCSGTFHVCSCHASAFFMVADADELESPSREVKVLRPCAEQRPADGHRSSIFRPPSA